MAKLIKEQKARGFFSTGKWTDMTSDELETIAKWSGYFDSSFDSIKYKGTSNNEAIYTFTYRDEDQEDILVESTVFVYVGQSGLELEFGGAADKAWRTTSKDPVKWNKGRWE